MLSHPPRVRSLCHAALSDEKILRRNFLGSFSFEMIFAFGRAAVRHQKCDDKNSKTFCFSKDGFSENRGLVAMRKLQKEKQPTGRRAERPQPIAAKRKARLSAGFRQTLPICKNLERAKGFEPSTPTLARSCSTTELHPHPRDWRRSLAGNGESYAKSAPRMQQPLQGPPIHRILGRTWRLAGESGPNRAGPAETPRQSRWQYR
jgi:hypothetical protein